MMAMNEFKYACPVCGQHIKCDSSQSGTVMECPTCFQKITAPQAPGSTEQKFILSGKKVEDRPKTSLPAAPAPAVVPHASLPLVAISLVVLLLAGAIAAGLWFAWSLHRHQAHHGPIPAPPSSTLAPGTPVVVAPPPNDTNWLFNLAKVTIPEEPVVGRLNGLPFQADHATLQNGTLTLRVGAKGSLENGLIINFNGAGADALAGHTINVTTNAPLAAKVTLRTQANGQVQKTSFDTGYALRLECGDLAANRLPGKIYFCAPDDAKSYVMGTFTAEVHKQKTSKPKPGQ